MRLGLVTLLLCSALLPLRADDASRLKKAEEYLLLTKADERMKQSVDIMLQSMTAQLESQAGVAALPSEATALAKEYQAATIGLMAKVLAWDSIKNEFAQLAADTFTEAELDDLLVFYKTSTGRSVVVKTEILMQKGALIGQRRAIALQPDITKLTQDFNTKMQELMRSIQTQPRTKQ